MRKTIIFTGGGSAGHVTVNIALIPKFINDGWKVYYIGSEDGIEKQLISRMNDVTYYSVSTGKLRRYFDLKNVKDPFKVVKGVYQAFKLIKKIKPGIIFSKGGFVSVPVVIGGWLNRVPVIIHESDITPGLANRISIPFASKVFTTFPETKEALNQKKSMYVGAVVREELYQGNRKNGLDFTEFTQGKPTILVMGGSLGAEKINRALRENLTQLLSQFQIIHICGKGNIDSSYHQDGYKQYEYINEELPHIFAMADIIVSRAGSNSIFEFLALKKPMLLIPLSRKASRGDQILNAKSFEKSGYCRVLMEEDLTKEALLKEIYEVYKNKDILIKEMVKKQEENPVNRIVEIIKQEAK